MSVRQVVPPDTQKKAASAGLQQTPASPIGMVNGYTPSGRRSVRQLLPRARRPRTTGLLAPTKGLHNDHLALSTACLR